MNSLTMKKVSSSSTAVVILRVRILFFHVKHTEDGCYELQEAADRVASEQVQERDASLEGLHRFRVCTLHTVSCIHIDLMSGRLLFVDSQANHSCSHSRSRRLILGHAEATRLKRERDEGTLRGTVGRE